MTGTFGALVALLVLIATPAAARAATAPGRVVYETATKFPVRGLEAQGAVASAVLPGGEIVAATEENLTVVRLRADGALEPSFGRGGIARLAVPGGVFYPVQILPRPDGRLVVVGGGAEDPETEVPKLLVAGLTPGGALDPGFGRGGFVALDVEPNCGFGPCTLADLGPDGSVVVTGAVGQLSRDVQDLKAVEEKPEWVVQRVTPAGAVDAAFGLVKIPGVAVSGTSGISPAITPTGAIVVLGEHDGNPELAGLTAAGKPDPSFGGGKLVPVAASDADDLLLHAGGAIDVMTASKIVRYTPAGTLDSAYGKRGVVDTGNIGIGSNLARILDGPGEGTTLWWVHLDAPDAAGRPRIGIVRVSPGGTLVGKATRLSPAFGGGRASDQGQTAGVVAQTSFAGDLHARPDGSLVAVGGVKVSQNTPSLVGRSAGYVAAAAFTAALAPDLRFGGPALRPTAGVRVASQRARAAISFRGVLARLTASSPGLLGVRVSDRNGRVLARSVEPVYVAGSRTARIPLTRLGRRVLRPVRNLGVRVRYDFRDLLAARASGATSSVLR